MRPTTGQRLNDIAGLKGRLLRNSSPPEVSSIQVVPVPSMRPINSSLYIYKSLTSSNRPAERGGHQVCDIPRQYPHHEPGRGISL